MRLNPSRIIGALDAGVARLDSAYARTSLLRHRERSRDAVLDLERRSQRARQLGGFRLSPELLNECFGTDVDEREPPTPKEIAVARRRAGVAQLPWMLPFWMLLVTMAVIDGLAFRIAGINYFEWFLTVGPAVSVLFAVVTAAVDLDRAPALIGADPFSFVLGVCDVFVEVYLALAVLFGRPRTDLELDSCPDVAPVVHSWYRSISFDMVVSVLFYMGVRLGLAAWCILIAPLQYWVNVVAGAPARQALASAETAWLSEGATPAHAIRLGIYTVGDKTAMPPGLTAITFATKPVTTTAAMSAALLWAVGALL